MIRVKGVGVHYWVAVLLMIKQVYAAEQIYYYHTDHLGTPQLMTDENQNIVWQVGKDPFGGDTPLTEAVQNNLRFPGQYYDQETGFHYNWNRYYDPTTGRYITSDPIGLESGLNSYSYVLQNPLQYFDPTGLIWVTVGHDYHGTKNWYIALVDRLANLEEGTVMSAHNCVGCTRDVIQEWVSHPSDAQRQNNICGPEDPVSGDKRKIRQTFGLYRNELSLTGESFYWSPSVASPTYRNF